MTIYALLCFLLVFRRLGNLVQMVDKMLLCQLLAVTRTNITSFVDETMSDGSSSKRSALFLVKLIFSPKSKFNDVHVVDYY